MRIIPESNDTSFNWIEVINEPEDGHSFFIFHLYLLTRLPWEEKAAPIDGSQTIGMGHIEADDVLPMTAQLELENKRDE